MKQYEVLFEIYGKKLKTTVIAKTESEAKQIVKDAIRFDRITNKTPRTKEPLFNDEMFEKIKDIFNPKK